MGEEDLATDVVNDKHLADQRLIPNICGCRHTTIG